jgi:hypothetical protein
MSRPTIPPPPSFPGVASALIATVVAAAAVGCGDKRLDPSRASGGAPSATTDASRPPELILPDAAAGATGPAATCAAETVLARRTPADLLFLVDLGPGVHAPFAGGTESKFLEAKKALFEFVMDPGSVGLGVALQFFPYGFFDKPCFGFRDCGRDKDLSLDGLTTYACTRSRVCQLDGQPPGTLLSCPDGLPPGPCLCYLADLCTRQPAAMASTCIEVGECSVSHNACYAIGKPCPGGDADGTCLDVRGKCNFPGPSCDPTLYESPVVPFGDLPAAAGPFLEALNLTEAQGGLSSPLTAAIQGTNTLLRQRLARPGARPTARVLVAEGKKARMTCSPDDPLGAVAAVEAAAQGTPPLPTYVIGVLSASSSAADRDVLTRLAAAGGTGLPILLDSAQDAGPRLLAALETVRTQALPCELTIPPARVGAALDYKKVNVTVTSGAGLASDLVYVGRADACPPGSGGWYYDTDPAAGRQPTAIRLCPATCDALKGDPKARVDLAFGCATRSID